MNHLVAGWLGIAWEAGYKRELLGSKSAEGGIVLRASSLAYHGIDWRAVAEHRGVPIELIGAPSASPAELEGAESRLIRPRYSVIGVSIYDMNEYFVSDVRPEMVPPQVSVSDLFAADLTWEFRKKMLSRYPQHWLRLLYPTAGRPETVLNNLRKNALAMVHRVRTSDADNVSQKGKAVAFGGESGSILDWPEGRRQRNLGRMRTSSGGRVAFNGPKSRALDRMLAAKANGRVVLLVMPVSSVFHRGLLSEAKREEFEAMLLDLALDHPTIEIVRLDKTEELANDRVFEDLIHLNAEGVEIATAEWLEIQGGIEEIR